jgi:hypothetical protein
MKDIVSHSYRGSFDILNMTTNNNFKDFVVFSVCTTDIRIVPLCIVYMFYDYIVGFSDV